MTTSVPLKPHLAQYITTIYGNPAIIPSTDQIHYDFIACLTKNYTPPANTDEWTNIPFQLTDRHINNIGHTFDPGQAGFFNARLTKRFHTDCYTFINYLIAHQKLSRRQAIYKVIERFELEEHYSYFTMKNIYKKIQQQISEIFPSSNHQISKSSNLQIQ